MTWYSVLGLSENLYLWVLYRTPSLDKARVTEMICAIDESNRLISRQEQEIDELKRQIAKILGTDQTVTDIPQVSSEETEEEIPEYDSSLLQ